MWISGIEIHYDNTPMQYTAIFHSCKKGDVSLIFTRNIDAEIVMFLLFVFKSLEAGLTSTHNLCFRAEI